ncbi:MAG: serine hydrolase [Candidatus Omnitrophota bacterium]
MNKKRILVNIFLAVFLPVISILSYQKVLDYKKESEFKVLLEKRRAALEELKLKLKDEVNKFKGESGVIIKDLESGWEFSWQKDKLFASASLVKLPIMAATFYAVEEGKTGLEQNIALKNSDKLTGSGTLKNIPAGTLFTLERLIGLMIYDSDNTATNIITNLLGIDYLNNQFKAFGLKNTLLLRKVADYSMRAKGVENYTNAEDVAFLLEKIYRGNLINKEWSEKSINILKLTHLNDRIPKYLPAQITVAHKTGLERNVCHDAGIVFTSKGDFLICVLTRYKNGDIKGAKEFIAKLASLTYSFTMANNLFYERR